MDAAIGHPPGPTVERSCSSNLTALVDSSQASQELLVTAAVPHDSGDDTTTPAQTPTSLAPMSTEPQSFDWVHHHLTTTIEAPVGRRPGRPKGSTTKKAVIGPKRRPGRPHGSGKHQLEAAQRLALGLSPAQKKRGRGRPKKIVPGTRAAPCLATSSSTTQGHAESPLAGSSNTLPSTASEPEYHPRAPTIIPENTDGAPHIINDESEDEDGEDFEVDAIGDGLGDDETELDKLDEDGVSQGWDSDEDGESGEGRDDSRRSKPKRIRHPLPSYIMDEYNTIIAENSRRVGDTPPQYLKYRTGWVPRQDTAYKLSKAKRLSPTDAYNPVFYLFDPMARCREKGKDIPCPNPSCDRRALIRHTHLSRPRRVVDFDEGIWLVGYRYRCPCCRQTYRCWDPKVMAVLPREIQLEFPAELSHRSGISKKLLNWVRPCLRGGMSGKRISDALRAQHLLQYDILKLQYGHEIKSRSLDHSWNQKFVKFPPFEDHGNMGYCGFVPSAQWLMNMYDKFIESHRDEIRQEMALLSLEYGAMDHSFKMPKQVRVVMSGEHPFVALHIVSNQYSEVRACHLVTTKGNSQVRPALIAMKESLNLFGHEMPRIFFTDNMADKGMLEEIFPSLTEGVVPVNKYEHLAELEIPSNVSVFLKRGTNAINDTVRMIMDDFGDDGSKEIVVGFDSEWNVELSSTGSPQHAGKTAIIQLAYKDQIYILQIAEMVAQGVLPAQLKTFLANPQVQKVGRLVSTDLKQLQEACNSPAAFCGGVDLARFAKDRCILPAISATGLADLCAMFLHRRINKLVPERLSDLWENESLTPRQIKYAAADAYASLRIYEEMEKFEPPTPLPATTQPEPATPVLMYSTDRTKIIAYGMISLQSRSRPGLRVRGLCTFDGIEIPTSRTVVDIFEVIIPGAKLAAHQNRCLQDFGKAPFTAVIDKDLLRAYKPPSNSVWSPYSGLPGSQYLSAMPPPPLNRQQANPYLVRNTGGNSALEISDQSDDLEVSGFESSSRVNANDENVPLGDLLFDDSSSLSEGDSFNHLDGQEGRYVWNGQAQAEGAAILGEPPEWSNKIRSRVLKDVFHVFNMFKISRRHGLRFDFVRKLRTAMLLDDEEDARKMTAFAAVQKPARTFEQLRAEHPKWVLKHVRRVIPPPEILGPRVREVLETYGSLEDSTTHTPLFDKNSWRVAKNVLDLISRGYLSDPPGVPLYSLKGIDKKGLPVYHCFRGTNRTEGGIHTHLRPHLPSSGTSIKHFHASLDDHFLHQNKTVGTYNRTGRRYRSHFHPWVTNELQELNFRLRHVLIGPDEFKDHINGNFYIQTEEVIGALPIPRDLQVVSEMKEFDPHLDGHRRHHYLARLQGVAKAVLPVHTPAESTLFRELMQTSPVFNTITGEPLWREGVRVWNRRADVDDNIFYKLIEQMKSAHTQWVTQNNVKVTLALTKEQRQAVETQLDSPSMQGRVPSIPICTNLPALPTRGLRPLSDMHEATEATNLRVPSSCDGSRPINMRVHMEGLGNKRIADDDAIRGPARKKKKKPRTCVKCESQECSGRRKQDLCDGSCTLCGRGECYGQNSKKRGRGCGAQVWPQSVLDTYHSVQLVRLAKKGHGGS